MTRLTLRLISLVIAGVVIYLAVTAVQVYAASRHDDARPAQAIVVLGAAEYNGCPSADLAARLDHAVSLWQRGDAPVLVVTGGKQPGDLFTEAQASAAYVERRGVPEADVLSAVGGSNSWQSLAEAAAVLKKRGDRRVILVSDPFHSARIAAIAHELGLQPLVSPTRTSPLAGTAALPYYAKEAAEMAIGRVVGFARLSGIRTDLGRVRTVVGGG
ncbi:MAG TPA: YdcF family protein [Acidimicrobiales bacterium]|nr:YdcF family protein [Acidimicrobiales bacterium]